MLLPHGKSVGALVVRRPIETKISNCRDAEDAERRP
jgi:hypothetical protein